METVKLTYTNTWDEIIDTDAIAVWREGHYLDTINYIDLNNVENKVQVPSKKVIIDGNIISIKNITKKENTER